MLLYFFLAAKDGAVDSIAVHAKMAKVSTKNGSQRKILFFIFKNPSFHKLLRKIVICYKSIIAIFWGCRNKLCKNVMTD